eukprot:g9430.t1
MGTTAYIGNKADSEARDSLEEQITRHLTDAGVEAAATIGERFRRLQYGVLDVTAFALRDALQEDFVLDGRGTGYPLTPAHVDLRDTEITAASSNLQEFYRQNIDVDLSRSVWYYADATDFTVEVPAGEEQTIIAQSARLDLLWPTMYINSNDTKAILVGAPTSTSNQVFRYFPGNELSSVEGSRFKCEFEEDDGSIAPCYDPTVRSWYTAAEQADKDEDTQLGEVVVTETYIDAIGSENDWLVTIARAVYGTAESSEGDFLGVVSVDVRLEQVQQSVEDIHFLDSGYSILATAAEGVVLAAGVWDREGEVETTTVCGLANGICSGGDDSDSWGDLLSDTENGGIKVFTSTSGEEESILVAAPVNATFQTTSSGGAGPVTHYVLSVVPKDEIFEPVDGMADLIQDSTAQIIFTTAIVACCTLIAVAAAVYVMSGSITRPIVKMTRAARSISRQDRRLWQRGGRLGVQRGGGSSIDSRTAGRYTMNRTRCLDYLICRGDDEISTLAREFSLMITGLGKRGSAAEAKGLPESSAYPKNPFTTKFTSVSAVACAVYAATLVVDQAEGHAMMYDPPSRQGENPGEWCPHCYNARGPAAVVARAKEYTEPEVLDMYGGGDIYPLSFGDFAPNGNYLEPDAIAVRHGICGDPEQGHMEFFLCDTLTMEDPEGLPTQSCFNQYPLTLDPPARFFELEDEGNPIPGYNVKARYYLPDIETSHAILQMVYYTGNSCKHVGYDDFNPPAGSWPGAFSSQRADWILRDLSFCSESTSYPEEFWGCSDIALSPDGMDWDPVPAPSPNPLGREDDNEKTINYEDVGCYDTTPGNWVVEGPWMSWNVCYLSCVSQGAYYMGLTNGATCYCDFDEDLDLASLGESTGCTSECTNEGSSDMCGGPSATTVLRILPGFAGKETVPSPTPEPVMPTPEYPEDPETPAPQPTPEYPETPAPQPTAEYPEYPETPAPQPTAEYPEYPETPETPEPATPAPIETSNEGECGALWEQCGGNDGYTGSTCCQAGTECVVMADCYSECRPAECTGEPVEMWGQCGGNGWTGSTCCVEGTECTVMAPCYSSCRPPAGSY